MAREFGITDPSSSDASPGVALQLTDLLSAIIQTRLMFEGLKPQIPDGAMGDFLPVVCRLFDVEIKLRQMVAHYPIDAVPNAACAENTIH